MSLRDDARAWLAEDPDPTTRAELAELLAKGDLDELADRFGARLEFGTAGLRGALGAGPNRMNRVVVIRAAAGLAAYLTERDHLGAGSHRVVIGYDARSMSDVFAEDTAAVLAGAGLEPLVLPRPLPTPVLAYSTRHLGCAAGVMVTASHNPRTDNGYKIYLGDGSQIIPPTDAEISAAIDAVGALADIPRSSTWTRLDDEPLRAYVDRVAGLVGDGPRNLSVVYTPLHGVGGAVVRTVLERTGFPAPHVVAEQAEPDPAFPTTPFPNPEEPGTLDLATALAARVGADLVIANDPDADRCSVAVPTSTGIRQLTGDEVGALLATHLLRTGRRGTFATTIVSSRLLGKIAARHGQRYVETLTGFKWLGRVPNLAFSYEEALGYCVDQQAVADKDGIATMLLVLELAAGLKAAGRTLLTELDDIARTYGLHHTEQLGVRMANNAEMEQVLERLRSRPPAVLGGLPVERTDDLREGSEHLPPTEGVRYLLRDDVRVVVRPSGTEPKLKCYFEVIEQVGAGPDAPAAARRRAAATAAAIRTDLAALAGLPADG